MKNIILLVFCSFLCACQMVSDFTKNNPVAVTIAVRQGVVAYISQGENIEQQKTRAVNARYVFEKIQLKIKETETIQTKDLLIFAESLIDFNNLSFRDRIIAQDILLIVSQYFKTPEINPNDLIVLTEILETSISATYLVK